MLNPAIERKEHGVFFKNKSMENKKSIGFQPFWIIAFLLGVAVYKEIDFEQLSFKKPALGILYLLTFLFSVFVIVRGMIKQNKQ